MATKPVELYEQDLYAWTQQPAAALRTHFRGAELQAAESFVEQIIAGLLKLDYFGQNDPRAHWRAEVLNCRRNADRKISPTIRPKVETDLEGRCAPGREIAAVAAMVHEPDLIRRLPKTCPYGWDGIWHRDVMAAAGIDLYGGDDAAPKRRGRRKT